MRVLCNVEPNERWTETMLHEFGHAVYDRELDPSPAPAPRARQRAPAARVDRFEEQQLHLASGGVPRQDPRRDHARIVDDEAVTRAEQVGKLGEAMILEAAARAVDDEQSRCIARRSRRLRDQLGRQLVVEIRKLHEPSVYTLARLSRRQPKSPTKQGPFQQPVRRWQALSGPCQAESASPEPSPGRWSDGAR